MTEQHLSEEEFLRNYDPKVFERPSTAVDTVIFTVIEEALHVLLVKRSHHPFRDCWSLVGGFIDLQKDKTIEATAKRKLEEKTGVKTPYLEQFATIGNKKRDPRGWSVTTVYFALISNYGVHLKAGIGATDIKWAKIKNGKVKEKLAFDHAEILSGCAERLRSKVLYTSLPVYLMPKDFTLGELQKVYEIIIGKKIDHKSFRRRILASEVLEETKQMKREAGRPAQLYRIRKNQSTHFFIRNIEGASE